MKTTDSIQKLSAALVKAQANIGGAIKSATNPHFKSSFANLGEVIFTCKAALTDQGIAVSQMLTTLDSGHPGLETILIHESGEWMSNTMPVVCAKQNDPQALGSAVTYARRYALQAALLIPAVDDDGEAAMFRNEASEPEKVQRIPVVAEANGHDKLRGNVAGPGTLPAPKAREIVEVVDGHDRFSHPTGVNDDQMQATADEEPWFLSERVSWGKERGLMISELSPANLRYFNDTWIPKKEQEGRTSHDDQRFIDALKAHREWQGKQGKFSKPRGGQASMAAPKPSHDIPEDAPDIEW